MSHEKTISDLAYHLWHARGCPSGSPEIDWAEAQRQVNGHAAAPAADEAQSAAQSPLTQPKKMAQR